MALPKSLMRDIEADIEAGHSVEVQPQPQFESIPAELRIERSEIPNLMMEIRSLFNVVKAELEAGVPPTGGAAPIRGQVTETDVRNEILRRRPDWINVNRNYAMCFDISTRFNMTAQLFQIAITAIEKVSELKEQIEAGVLSEVDGMKAIQGHLLAVLPRHKSEPSENTFTLPKKH